MTIIYQTGNIVDSPMQTMVNTVNCVGVMGAGVALAYKERFPEMFQEYQQACKQHYYEPGCVHMWVIPTHQGNPTQIANCATKNHWRNPSSYEWITDILCTLRELIEKGVITSLALPKLGCGHGGLNWNTVEPMVMHFLGKLDIPIELYASIEDIPL
jgi:O-acetyl-ADP-ribose deacetylase (regulator of RNase III)